MCNGKLCVEHITLHAGHRSLGYHAKSACRANSHGWRLFFVYTYCYIDFNPLDVYELRSKNDILINSL